MHIAPSAPEYLAALKYEMLSEDVSFSSIVKVLDAEDEVAEKPRTRDVTTSIAVARALLGLITFLSFNYGLVLLRPFWFSVASES